MGGATKTRRRALARQWLAIAPRAIGAIAAACGGGDSSSAPQGGERQACYPNGTCNAGLTCLSEVCVVAGAGADGGVDAAAPNDAASVDVADVDARSTNGDASDAAPFDAASFDASGCSLADDVQPIFTSTCAVTACHVSGTPGGGLDLTAGASRAMVVNVVSVQNPPMVRVAPGDPSASYLYLKITGHQVAGTAPMPPVTTGIALTAQQKDAIACWITQGALDD